MQTTTTRPDPLAHPRAIKIPLDFEQSECLFEHGEVFIVITRQTHPGNPACLQLLAVPVSLDVAKAAESVALGRAKATRQKPVTGARSAP
jgi:hypothetical protein